MTTPKTKDWFGIIFRAIMLILLLTAQMLIFVQAEVNPIKHVVVIIQENHTFGNYFGTYPDANGINSSIALPTTPNSSDFASPYHLSSVVPPLDFRHDREVALEAYNN